MNRCVHSIAVGHLRDLCLGVEGSTDRSTKSSSSHTLVIVGDLMSWQYYITLLRNPGMDTRMTPHHGYWSTVSLRRARCEV
jgi:hypothetical protein